MEKFPSLALFIGGNAMGLCRLCLHFLWIFRIRGRGKEELPQRLGFCCQAHGLLEHWLPYWYLQFQWNWIYGFASRVYSFGDFEKEGFYGLII